MRQLSLQQLLPERHFVDPVLATVQVNGLSIDSRSITPGMLFLACQGERVNGVEFIDAAIANGAVAVLVSAKQGEISASVPVVAVEHLEQRLGELADRFYGSPSAQLSVVGITGTNGKTSTSHFIATALQRLGSPAAVIGTNGYGFLDAMQTASHTTPDVVRVHQLMAELYDQGAQNLVMEVSSHALEQGRVKQVRFQQAVFTNLTRDHLDYHGNMQAYGAAKARLFSEYDIKHAVINLDDPFAAELLKQLPAGVHASGYGMAPSRLAEKLSEQQICMERYKLTTDGVLGQMSTAKGLLNFHSPLLGRFNLSNLMATVAVLQWRGYANNEIDQLIPKLQGVAGRMERVEDPQGRLLVIDYAHTPDALEKVLQSLREHCAGKLWCLFGCGGDRDSGKRSQMGRIAERCADAVVVTSDNPRSESPQVIIADILSGVEQPERVQVEEDRAQAISQVLAQSRAGDVVLIAGKGHEDYQEVAGVRHPFSDREQIQRCLEVVA